MIGISIYIIFIVIGIIGLLLGSFGQNTLINHQYSPNKMYRINVIDNDQGALGGATIIELDRIYYGLVKKRMKDLYDGRYGENPSVQWINNNTVRINGRTMNIRNYDTWNSRH